jgi:leucyl aminopeptidase
MTELHPLSASLVEVEADLLAVGLLAGEPPQLPDALQARMGEALSPLMEREKFTGKAEASLVLPTLGALPAPWLALVGLGEGLDDQVRGAAGVIGRAARAKGLGSVALHLGALGERDVAAPAIEGFLAGNYAFERHKAEKGRKPACDTLLLAAGGLDAAAHRASVIAQAQATVRDLVNEPANVLYPETFAAFAASLASERMSVTVWDEEKIEAEGMGGLYAVGRGSARKPRFVHMHYRPDASPLLSVALVGKGVTYDSGGMSLKPSEGQQTMRCDMAGAATVVGAMQALDRLGLPLEVHGIFGAAENMNASDSYKLGDVLTMYDGTTVEVHNTDAEGRLVLADCLVYASRLGVDRCVDLATLTGACVVALGSRYTGLFTEDDALAEELMQAAGQAGDGLWRLPLAEHFGELLKVEWADTNHMGGRWGGASIAAAFLGRFVDGPRWAHLDIAGPAFLDKPERYYGKGATGAMLRTLVVWLEGLAAGR